MKKFLGIVLGGVAGYGFIWLIEPDAMLSLRLIFVGIFAAVGFAIMSGKKSFPIIPGDF